VVAPTNSSFPGDQASQFRSSSQQPCEALQTVMVLSIPDVNQKAVDKSGQGWKRRREFVRKVRAGVHK